MKLTAELIAAITLPAGKTDVIFFDGTLPGFGLRVRASGRRMWVAQYRLNGRTRRATLGNAEIISAEQARLAAKKLLSAVTLRDQLDATCARVAGIPLIVIGGDELRRHVRTILDDAMAKARADTTTPGAAP